MQLGISFSWGLGISVSAPIEGQGRILIFDLIFQGQK